MNASPLLSSYKNRRGGCDSREREREIKRRRGRVVTSRLSRDSSRREQPFESSSPSSQTGEKGSRLWKTGQRFNFLHLSLHKFSRRMNTNDLFSLKHVHLLFKCTPVAQENFRKHFACAKTTVAGKRVLQAVTRSLDQITLFQLNLFFCFLFFFCMKW